MSRLQFRVYRLDIELEDLASINLVDIPNHIITQYNETKSTETYLPLPVSPGPAAELDETHKAYFYIKTNNTGVRHSWKTFFAGAGVDFGNIRTEMHHMVCFVVDTRLGQVLVLTAGQAYVTFERFVDYNFPLEIARRIAKPEIKSGEVKGLTGYLQASTLQFRRPRRVSLAETVSSIWTQLSGYVRSDVLSSPAFQNIFDDNEKVGIEIKASVLIRQKIDSIPILIKYADWLLDVYYNHPIPPDTASDFAFLDGVKKLSYRRNPTTIDRLNTILLQKITDGDFEDLEICHKDHVQYLNADQYIRIHDGTEVEFGTAPVATEGFNGLPMTTVDAATILDEVRIEAQYTSEPARGVVGTLRELLCGEVVDGDKTYFLLNKEWYELRNDFLEVIKNDFNSYITDDDSAAGLTMPTWNQPKEHEYNLAVATNTSYIMGDVVFTENTELFDLLHWDDDKVYVIHVKESFGVKVRDVSSQIFNAAQIIESDIGAGKTLLKSHYDKIVAKYGIQPLTKAEFIAQFSKPRAYVLAYGTRTDIATNTTAVRSNIARLELVQLRNDMRRFENKAHLKLQWINKP